MAVITAKNGILLIKTRYEERHQARDSGCRWSKSAQAWVIPPDTLLEDIIDHFGPCYIDQNARDQLLRQDTLADYLMNLKNADDAVIKHPDHLSPYQRVGVRYLADAGRAILADDVGLGKTCQAIRAVMEVGATRTLIVCPKSLIHNWKREISQWSGSTPGILLSDSSEVPQLPWVITNYEAATKHFKILQDFEALIVDEAARIKNRKAKRSDTVHKLAQRVKWCWLLTATPAPNNPAELWSLLHAIKPDKYTSYWRWVERRCITYRNPWGGVEIFGLKDPERFTQDVGPFILRRNKTLLHLPPLSQETIYTELAKEQMRLYKELRQLFIARLDEERMITAPSVLAQLTRLRQVCCSPALIGGVWDSEKTEVILDLIEDNAETHKILIFSTFSEYIKLLEEALSQYGPVRITGDMSINQRDAAKQRFSEDSSCRVLLGTIGAMGEGLNLQTASLVIFANRDWVPASNEQAIGRAWRRGQERPVHVINLVTADTVEEHVESLLKAKQMVSGQVNLAALADILRKEVHELCTNSKKRCQR